MSKDERPEFQALEELQEVLSDLMSELSAWRRRALKAEGESAELGASYNAVGQRERIIGLEAENEALQARLDAARDRLKDLLGRLRFLEEQVSVEEQAR